LGRVAPPEIANYFAEKHRQEGVDVILGVMPEAIKGTSRADAIILADGTEIPADIIIVGIGIIPNTQLAERAGLDINNGITVDQNCRTSRNNIFAVGDVACRFHPFLNHSIRHESWQNALTQGDLVAQVMCDLEVNGIDIPWVWSDQYDVNFQMAGAPPTWDEIVIRGDISLGEFTLFQLYRESVVGVITVNRGKDMVVAKRLVGVKIKDRKLLADESLRLRKLLPK
jgi:3-phenylpropionate/trans-cinnamate dioxygenase ferredoxin reductase subunit